MRTPEATRSRLLDSLPPVELEAIDGDLERVRLDPGRTLVPPMKPSAGSIFPIPG